MSEIKLGWNLTTDEITLVDPKELSESGILHEVNRLFFHPIGMALAVELEDDGTWSMVGVIDHRADAAGVTFATVDEDKVQKFKELQRKRHRSRLRALGFYVQPSKDDA